MKAARSGIALVPKTTVSQGRPVEPATDREIVWETVGKKDPHVENGLYGALILAWKPTRPFGRRDGITFELKLLGGPSDIGMPDPLQTNEPPPDGYDEPGGAVLRAHFNISIIRGVVRLGSGSKLFRAFKAAFDGRPPASFDPDCLVGRRVSCVVTTVTNDSKGNRLHPSCWYSIVDTFVGPGSEDPEEEPLF